MSQARHEYVLGDGNIFFRDHMLDAGEEIPDHGHNFGHTSLVISGAFDVTLTWAGGRAETTALGPGDAIYVPEHVQHRIVCRQAGRFMCLYSHRDAQGRVVQRYQGNNKAYV